MTAHLHAGRLFAPNYHPDYAEKVAKGEFKRKKGYCDDICDTQKGYAADFFRIMKWFYLSFVNIEHQNKYISNIQNLIEMIKYIISINFAKWMKRLIAIYDNCYIR